MMRRCSTVKRSCFGGGKASSNPQEVSVGKVQERR